MRVPVYLKLRAYDLRVMQVRFDSDGMFQSDVDMQAGLSCFTEAQTHISKLKLYSLLFFLLSSGCS